MEYRPPLAIGIDLGTTYSAVACLDHSGQPHIIPNSEGERTTPSNVLFDPAQGYFVCAFPAGGPMPIAIPGNCALTGLTFIAQGGSVSPSTCALANALEVTVGGF